MKKKEKVKQNNKQQDKSLLLSLTKKQLIHLRDLFSISLPPDKDMTVSHSLALLRKRSKEEVSLWEQICELCEKENVDLGESAPDFVVSITSVPPMGVFEVLDEDEEAGE
jgi:hypothetical protein